MAIGLPVLWIGSRLPVRAYRILGYPLLLLSFALLVLVLVPGIGVNVSGATRWIDLPGGLQIQPSEPAEARAGAVGRGSVGPQGKATRRRPGTCWSRWCRSRWRCASW